MAKKHFKAFVALAAVAGAAAAGVSYFLRYKSFHKELEEEFHGFEDGDQEDDFGDDSQTSQAQRTYVTLSKDKDEDFVGYDDYMVPKKKPEDKVYPEGTEFPDEDYIEHVHHGETDSKDKHQDEDYNCTYMQDCKLDQHTEGTQKPDLATTITEDTAQ